MFSIQSAENLKVNRSLTLQPTGVPLSIAGPHIFLHGAFPRFPSCTRPSGSHESQHRPALIFYNTTKPSLKKPVKTLCTPQVSSSSRQFCFRRLICNLIIFFFFLVINIYLRTRIALPRPFKFIILL